MAWFLVALLCIAGAVEPLSWGDLDPAASRAWARGPGAVFEAQRDGLRAARASEPPGRFALEGQVAPILGAGAPPLDDNTQLLVTTTIGGRRAARRGWWQAQLADIASVEAAERLAYLDEARALWLDAWVASSLGAHLIEHADDLDARIAALRPGERDGLVAQLTLDELAVEVGRLRAEAATSQQRAEVARVALCGHLAREVRVDPAGLPSIESPLPDAANPWEALIEYAGSFPELRALDAREQAATAEARAHRRGNPPTVGVGAIYRDVAYDSGPPGPLISLAVPLGNPFAPEARRAEAEAEATRRARAFAAERRLAVLRAEATALRAAEARHALLRDRVEGPLAVRVERLSDAVARGLAPIQLLLLARRDLHEAFHSRADAAAEVLVRRSRGQVLLAWIRQEGER